MGEPEIVHIKTYDGDERNGNAHLGPRARTMVYWDCDTREIAAELMCELWVPCPLKGYIVRRATVATRSRKGGQKCQLQMQFDLREGSLAIDSDDEIQDMIEEAMQ